MTGHDLSEPEQAAVAKWEQLTPKAKQIVRVLLGGYGGPLTRNELAAGLRQPYLYAHDRKLLDQLATDGFVMAYKRQRIYHLAEQDEWWAEAVAGVNRRARWGHCDLIWLYEPGFTAQTLKGVAARNRQPQIIRTREPKPYREGLLERLWSFVRDK